MTTAADALYLTVKNYSGGVEALAVRIGMSAQILRNKVNPNYPKNHPTLDDVEKVMDLTGDYRVLHSLAQNSGHILIRQQDGATSSDVAVLEMIAQVWASNGEVGNAVFDTLADGRVEKHEVMHVKACIYRAQKALLELGQRLEGMSE